MGLRKGQASEAYKQGKMEKYNFANLSEEEKKAISKKGLEARKKNAEKRKTMNELLQKLLNLDVKSKKNKDLLRSMGIEDNDMSNKMLLAVALFKKGLSGDVGAIEKIINYSENITDDTIASSIVINVQSVSGKTRTIKTDGKGQVDITDDEDDWEE